ncbi:hypothetical protein B0H17DRAFT_1033040 [Mycena rosella]|uniref:Uncharacterized protein n=1 Tax=Mycena rosella TaxID=1033263 RepID=A0AAD7GXN1_MYCRO|nr:hypothetical protein B0H17DRAFT_1033040 [Mycena rosella]
MRKSKMCCDGGVGRWSRWEPGWRCKLLAGTLRPLNHHSIRSYLHTCLQIPSSFQAMAISPKRKGNTRRFT